MRLRPAEFKILQHLREARLGSDFPATLHMMLSGGKDSVALLEILHTIARLPQSWSGVHFSITLHHFNHKRRGLESEQDEALCADLARRLGLPLVVHRWTEALENELSRGANFHALAREWRYQSVRDFAERAEGIENECNWLIVTAHHRRDHAETLLHNLVRGCGISGLQSMPPWSPQQRLLRPLLWLPSSSLESYIRNKSLPHHEDSSNQKLDYTRNRLRGIVLKELEKINPKTIEHIWTLSQDLRLHGMQAASQSDLTSLLSEHEPSPPHGAIALHQLGSISDLRTFLLSAAPELAGHLTRKKLTNLLSHVRKLAANRSQCEEYKIAVSEQRFVTINRKRLELKVTS